MTKQKALEKKRQEFRILPEWEDLIEQKAKGLGYDYKSQYYTSLIKEDIFDMNRNNQQVADIIFDYAPILEAVQRLYALCLQILENQNKSAKEETVLQINDSLLEIYPLDDLKLCTTVDEIRILMKPTHHRYVYNLLNYLQSLGVVVRKEYRGDEKLYWKEG